MMDRDGNRDRQAERAGQGSGGFAQRAIGEEKARYRKAESGEEQRARAEPSRSWDLKRAGKVQPQSQALGSLR